MSINFKYKDTLCDILNKSKKGLILSISIDNFFLFLTNKEKCFPEELMINLQKIIANETSSQSFRLTYNIFFIIKNNIKKEKIKLFIKKISSIIENYIPFNSKIPIYISCSIGYKYFDKNKSKESVECILDKSIIALHTAIIKKETKICNYDTEIISTINQFCTQMIKTSYLHYAVLTNNIQLAFQPIICSKTGNIKFYESLLRIVIKDKNIISAGEFVKATENFGFIDKIDKTVFNMVVKELLENENIKLSVNLSTYSLENNDFLLFCKNSLKDKEISNRLIIEITETGFQSNYNQIRNFINEMRTIGCKIAIDDFGSGYTSIKQLSLFSIDFIKIDGSFIQNLKNNKKNQTLITIITNIAHSLNIKTIAEFVDEVETVNILHDIGVDFMQGNHFSPAATCKSWLKASI